jgi:hypothetical protein
MTSSETAAAIDAFVDSYRSAFERLDAAGIADHFAYPSHITSDAEAITLVPMATKQDCLAAVEKVLAMHRQLGAPSGAVHDLWITEFSPRLAQASLRMEVRDATARTLYDFEATYTLARIDGAWRITAIAHNQIPRLLACLARRERSTG